MERTPFGNVLGHHTGNKNVTSFGMAGEYGGNLQKGQALSTFAFKNVKPVAAKYLKMKLACSSGKYPPSERGVVSKNAKTYYFSWVCHPGIYYILLGGRHMHIKIGHLCPNGSNNGHFGPK